MSVCVCHLPSSVSVDSSVDLQRCPKLDDFARAGVAWPAADAFAAGETCFLSHM